MYHYLFTNDLRIRNLEQSIVEAARCFIDDSIPSALEDKAKNNNIMTLGFYFNLTKSSNCSKIAVEGDVRKVVLNFIKKFQFPNIRTKESFLETKSDDISLAPMRVIMKLLYLMYISEGGEGYITSDEICEFIFYNDAVAKNRNPNIIDLYHSIKKFRAKGIKPDSIETDISQRIWNQEDRQIKEIVKVLLWSGCVKYDDEGNLRIHHDALSRADMADIFEIVTESNFWDGDSIEAYRDYMDIKTVHEDSSYFLFKTGLEADFERNRIKFGAPGTGKSYDLNSDMKRLIDGTSGTYERVTFHPDYTYSNFVGSYKPVSDDSEEEKGKIKYEFVPGPFMRVYVDALKSGRRGNPQPHLLLIEEINRAKVAAVFGDVFQLLDRDDDGVSEYEIHATEDIRKHLAKELGGNPSDYDRIQLPDNMFIWATMNSADQGVFPMDTAFKRRWNFEYLGIDHNEVLAKGKITLGKGEKGHGIEWNLLRKAINHKLATEYKVNEDKLIGPFFLSKDVIRTDSEKGLIADPEKFLKAFKSKVIMYLYEDAAKQFKHRLFEGCKDKYSSTRYSSVCDAFDEIGVEIFGENFKEDYYEKED